MAHHSTLGELPGRNRRRTLWRWYSHSRRHRKLRILYPVLHLALQALH